METEADNGLSKEFFELARLTFLGSMAGSALWPLLRSLLQDSLPNRKDQSADVLSARSPHIKPSVTELLNHGPFHHALCGFSH